MTHSECALVHWLEAQRSRSAYVKVESITMSGAITLAKLHGLVESPETSDKLDADFVRLTERGQAVAAEGLCAMEVVA